VPQTKCTLLAIDYYKNKILKEQAKKNSKEDNS
jgi:hypothetical protein